jgi:hypothetical protein
MSLRYKPFDGSLKDISPSQLLTLKDVREGWYVEYKSALIEPKKLAKSLASFANQYGGWLFLGVQEDPKELVADSFPGIENTEVTTACENIKNASKDLLNPEVFYDYRIFKGPIKDINLPAGRSVIAICIPESADTPHVHKDGRIYRRVGDSSDPKPETDRFILDRLWERGKRARERLAEFVSHEPIVSEEEKNRCYLHLSILSDPYEIKGDRYRKGFDDFCRIMREDPLPFTNVFTHSRGFVARQAANNNPYQRILTWEFYRQCHSFITMPINFTYGDEDHFLFGYDHREAFLRHIRDTDLRHCRILDLNWLFQVITEIARRHRLLVSEAGGVYGPFFVKAHLQNVWRAVPFLEMPTLLKHIETHDVPVVQQADMLVPAGDGLQHCVVLQERGKNAPESMDTVVDDAISICCPIFEGLGIPIELFTKAATELINTGAHASRVQQLRNGKTNKAA